VERASINLIKNLKKQIRENRYLLFLDNLKIIKDAVKSNYFKPIVALVEKEEYADGLDCETYLANANTIKSLTDVKTPQGVCVMVEYIPHIVKRPETNFLVLDNIQDPGNAGTLIRTALATGFNTVIMIDGVHLCNPKVVRSTVGAIFNLEIYEMSREKFIQFANEWKIPLLKADMNGENIFETSISEQVGVVIGNEGQGVSEEVTKLCSKTVKIPMNKGIESLNAGVSGSIIMYQINKDLLKQ
jgi:TrmH family RNA methyltransferase